ncbi:hypothetical protein SKP52_03335 [Sphingopyxis fribergensis]|uniref:Secreted protein n=1 Tax=Sphingopyxis fribergensis TaxID=1515612 RepID=A0A0A7PBX5_9SPHN|nr:hypothetical protein [Sphingopyxis fribergensis]AJA07596.1 hypothetical protein SKP52_03335 [Sphingopyxis fribergensis]
MRGFVSIFCAVGFSIAGADSALAQNGAMWVDDKGRTTILGYGGPDTGSPISANTPVGDMVDLFDSVCLPKAGKPHDAATTLAAENRLEARPFIIAGTKKEPPIELAIWHAPGAVLAATDGFFAAPQAQCNAVFYVNALPDRAELVSAMQSKYGAPVNADEATDKNGKPRKYYTPEWSITSNGNALMVSATLMAASRSTPGNRVHLAARLNGNVK